MPERVEAVDAPSEIYLASTPDDRGGMPTTAPPRRISWIAAPPEICTLCKEPLGNPEETSAWNGLPAHRECVRIHLVQRDPAFREPDAPELPDEGGDDVDGMGPRDDDEADPG